MKKGVKKHLIVFFCVWGSLLFSQLAAMQVPNQGEKTNKPHVFTGKKATSETSDMPDIHLNTVSTPPNTAPNTASVSSSKYVDRMPPMPCIVQHQYTSTIIPVGPSYHSASYGGHVVPSPLPVASNMSPPYVKKANVPLAPPASDGYYYPYASYSKPYLVPQYMHLQYEVPPNMAPYLHISPSGHGYIYGGPNHPPIPTHHMKDKAIHSAPNIKKMPQKMEKKMPQKVEKKMPQKVEKNIPYRHYGYYHMPHHYGYYHMPYMYGPYQNNIPPYPNRVKPLPGMKNVHSNKLAKQLKKHRSKLIIPHKKCKKHQQKWAQNKVKNAAYKLRGIKNAGKKATPPNVQPPLTSGKKDYDSSGGFTALNVKKQLVNNEGEYLCQEKINGVRCNKAYADLERLKAHLMMNKAHHPDVPSVKCTIINCTREKGIYSISGVVYHIKKAHTKEEKKKSQWPYYYLVHEAWGTKKIEEYEKKLGIKKKKKKRAIHSCTHTNLMPTNFFAYG